MTNNSCARRKPEEVGRSHHGHGDRIFARGQNFSSYPGPVTPSGYLNQWNIRTYDDRTVAVLGGSSKNYQVVVVVVVVSRAERGYTDVFVYMTSSPWSLKIGT